MLNKKIKNKDIKKDSLNETTDSNDDSFIADDDGYDFVNDINVSHSDSYHENLPSNINIFSHIEGEIPKVKNEKVKKNTILFIKKLKEILFLQKDDLIVNDIDLKPISLGENEDGSVIIEWLFKEYRVGFLIGQDFIKSSWYVVSIMENNENYNSGLLSSIDLTEFFNKILKNVTSIS